MYCRHAVVMSGLVYGELGLRGLHGPYAKIMFGPFVRVTEVSPEQLDVQLQMASMSADRAKLLFAVPGTSLAQLTWPPAIYLADVQWALLVEKMQQAEQAADDAAKKGFLPPPSLTSRTVEELRAVVEGATGVRGDSPSVAAINGRPPETATFTAWWKRCRREVPAVVEASRPTRDRKPTAAMKQYRQGIQ